MRSYRRVLHFNIPARREIVYITGRVLEAVNESGISDGLILVNAMNITASVFINDDWTAILVILEPPFLTV